jgi:glycolate oxidase iron-sulfur subunit
VHCGFCLQACPTFLVTSDEADGPRGRIDLMQGFARESIPARDATLHYHLDRCLGCRACETACPSGVAYGHALETVRHAFASFRPIPWPVRLSNAVMATRGVRRILLGASRLVRPLARKLAHPSRAGFLLGMLGATRADAAPTPTITHTTGTRGRVALFTGCVMDDLFGHVHAATERVLRANGLTVERPARQGCCGALHAHAGDREAARRLARDNVRAFASLPDDTPIVVNSAGCGAMLREYAAVLADDELGAAAAAMADRVRDVTETLAALGPRPGGPLARRIVYDAPCHLLHAQRVADPPLQVLGAIPELEIVPHAEADLCCGSAGSYTLAEPELSRAVLARKLDAILAVSPDAVVTGNPGCIMQIGGGLLAARTPIPVLHPVELLDRSYAAAGLYEDTHDD